MAAKVSVIIPTYNRARYICEAIDSVLQQTFRDIEVIVVDDGSTDDTKGRIGVYAGKIEYIYTANGGPAHARNVGMERARGEYISFLDSDDLYYPYKTELQVAVLEKYKDIALVCSEFSAFDDFGYWEEYHLKQYHSAFKKNKLEYEDIYPEKITLKEAGLDAQNHPHNAIYMGNIFDTYVEHLVIATNTVMFRRDVLKTVGLQDERYWLFEEYEFVLRISRHYKIGFIDVPTYKIRNHEHQISFSNEKERHMRILVQKQANLLEIAKNHLLMDQDYYQKNKDRVDKRLAVLLKALAIPLMVRGKDNKKARKLLKECFSYANPEHFLWLTTFAPYVVRRVVVKLYQVVTE